MPPKIDHGTLIILDIGQNVSEPEEKNKKSFFEEARECTARLIERKILNLGKNFMGVMLMGSSKTKNNMAAQCAGAFRHIELLSELQAPTWQMIRDLPEKPSSKKSDWLEAIIVAADHYKNGVSNAKIINKKIILMTNFQVPTELAVDDIEQVLCGLKEDHFEVDVIGPDIYEETQKNEDAVLARKIVEATNGVTAHFDDTMNYLLFHRKKQVFPVPWNVDLTIGPNIKIPVSSFVRTRDEPVVKNWIRTVKDPVTCKTSTTESIMKEKVHINTENQTAVESSEVIKGYVYGEKIIPFSESDRAMIYQSGGKSLSVYGFTHKSNITWQNLCGDGLSYVFGRKGNKKAQEAIRCLVECLHELNMVGIVRRVYNKGNAPKMFVLMPVIDSNNYVCLSMTAIAFKDEIKMMAFPPTNLKKYACTDEQVNAFKDLVKAMDLTNAYDETYDEAEAFPIAETVSPSAQYILDCIAFRAMNPGKPLPQPRNEIMMLFKQPPLVEKRSRDALEKVKTLFPLKPVEVKTRKQINNDGTSIDNNLPIKYDQADEPTSSNQLGVGMPKIQLPKKNDEVHRVGTADPITDFKALKDNGKTLADLSPEMTEAIENLVYINLDGKYSKALNTMKFFRTECVNSDPSFYNNWMLKFRTALNDRKKHDVLGLITEQRLNFILKEENSLSTYDTENSHEDSQLYENDTLPNSTELTIRSEVNDIFDEM